MRRNERRGSPAIPGAAQASLMARPAEVVNRAGWPDRRPLRQRPVGARAPEEGVEPAREGRLAILWTPTMRGGSAGGETSQHQRPGKDREEGVSDSERHQTGLHQGEMAAAIDGQE